MQKPKQKDYLLHPILDILMVGGLSIIFFAFLFVSTSKGHRANHLGWTMFNLSLLVNYPHFLISYQFLYIDNFKKMTREWRFFSPESPSPT